MNYYKKHLGDYAKKTGHLSPLEHGVYGLIMDAYYDREQGPTLVEATRWARARTEDEKSAVLAVLDEFFTLRDDGRYVNSRIEEDIVKWRARGWFPSDPNAPKLRQSIDEWKITRLRIFARDNYTCRYCGTRGTKLECDHVVPVSAGGTSDDDNLVASCKPCNRSKSNKTLVQWLAEIGRSQ